MSKKEEIIRYFYDEHLKPIEIANKLDVVKSYVTKIIQKDERYIEEKEYRKEENKEKRKASKRNYINNRKSQERIEYQALLIQINKDNEYLSTKNEISDEAFAKWNRGMFAYAKNCSDLVLKAGITVGYDVPRRVRNVVNPSCIRATV